MSGSVSRSGNGWQYVIDAGLDAHGRRRQHRCRGFATKRLAEAAMVEAQNAALHGELVSGGRRTVAEYLEQWLAAVKASLEPAGYTNYRNCLTLYVVPRLGHVQLLALAPLTLSTLYADVAPCRRAGRTAAVEHYGPPGPRRDPQGAQRRGAVGAARQEPCRTCGCPEAAQTSSEGLDPGAGLSLPLSDAGDRMQVCWLLALSTGMRRGELGRPVVGGPGPRAWATAGHHPAHHRLGLPGRDEGAKRG